MNVVNKIGSGKVLVIGDVMLDSYVWGEVKRISPEAPVQIVRVRDRSLVLGGAGNVAANLAGLKCPVFLTGIRGTDQAGDQLAQLLDRPGIESRLITDPSRPTITKTRIMAQGQQLLRLDEEDTDIPDAAILDRIEDLIGKIMPSCQAVVLSDYGKGALGSLSFVQEIIATAGRHGVPVLVDPKGTDWDRYRGATCITPNTAEFEAAAGCSPDSGREEFEKQALSVLRQHCIEWLLVTRGSLGMNLFGADHPPLAIPARAREVYDVSGAGDTVIATLAAGISSGLSFPDSAVLANTAAGIVVGKLGTQPVGRNELESAARLSQTTNGLSFSKQCELDAARLQIKSWRASGAKIVFTNGCFDLLHPGHIRLLQQARDLGDRLIVGLNADVSVTRLKGQNRPILTERDRAALLASLACVDMVVIFSEDTPLRLIEALRPDILVKGADYKVEEVVGRDVVEKYGGKVALVPIAEGFSTTGIVSRILG